jgi:tight adherence protein B
MVRRRARLALVLACLTVFFVPRPAAASGDVSVRGADVSDFPTVRLTVSTAEPLSSDVRDVQVIENGVPVQTTSLDTFGAEPGHIDAVLAIDASNSMRGEPLNTALAAARTFLAGVPASMPLGVVTFSDDPVVLAPLTADRASVERAVGSLTATTSQGTALFNTVSAASDMFTGTGQHNLVLLTDGRCKADPTESGPCTLDGSLEEAVTAATDAGVTVFTIGLSRTGAPVPTLERLAQQTGGEHSLITIEQLETVYAGLAEQLSGQYVVEYRSKAPLGAQVVVVVHTPVGRDAFGFVAPGQALIPKSADSAATSAVMFWATPLGMGIVSAFTFLAVLIAGLMTVSVAGRRRRLRDLRRTVELPPPPPGADPSASDVSTTFFPQRVGDSAENLASKTSAGRRLARRLEHAGWGIRSGEFLLVDALGVVVLAVAGFVVATVVGALVGAVIGGVVPFAVLSHAASSRQNAMQKQLADTLMVIASSMRAGHSFLQSLDSAVKEADEPTAGEFGRVLREIRLGRDTDQALDALVERVGSQDLEWAVTAIKIQRKIGGNLAEVLETVANTVRERETLRRQVRVLSAEGRISIVVLSVLPILLAGYIMVVNPEYLRTLTSTRPGIFISVAGAALMGVGYIWMRKIVRLNV